MGVSPKKLVEKENAHQRSVHDVTIAGLPLKLKSSHDEESVKRLAGYVDEKIREALPHSKGAIQVAAVIACLNIAEELQMLKSKALKEIESVEQEAECLLNHLEVSRSSRAGLGH